MPAKGEEFRKKIGGEGEGIGGVLQKFRMRGWGTPPSRAMGMRGTIGGRRVQTAPKTSFEVPNAICGGTAGKSRRPSTITTIRGTLALSKSRVGIFNKPGNIA